LVERKQFALVLRNGGDGLGKPERTRSGSAMVEMQRPRPGVDDRSSGPGQPERAGGRSGVVEAERSERKVDRICENERLPRSPGLVESQ